MNKTIEETTKELNLNLDVSLALAKAESNLNELARQSNSSDWQGTITQGIEILDALNAVQKAKKAFEEIKQNKSK
jgi:HAMP domain-containing protein